MATRKRIRRSQNIKRTPSTQKKLREMKQLFNQPFPKINEQIEKTIKRLDLLIRKLKGGKLT